jgi:hypothetical protein
MKRIGFTEVSANEVDIAIEDLTVLSGDMDDDELIDRLFEISELIKRLAVQADIYSETELWDGGNDDEGEETF